MATTIPSVRLPKDGDFEVEAAVDDVTAVLQSTREHAVVRPAGVVHSEQTVAGLHRSSLRSPVNHRGGGLCATPRLTRKCHQ